MEKDGKEAYLRVLNYQQHWQDQERDHSNARASVSPSQPCELV